MGDVQLWALVKETEKGTQPLWINLKEIRVYSNEKDAQDFIDKFHPGTKEYKPRKVILYMHDGTEEEL